MSTNFKPSPYQEAILTFVRNETGSAIVNAVAGSGKTSTLMLLNSLITELNRSVIFLAFNKSIATELERRGANARTFHSVGFSAVRRVLYGRNKGRNVRLDARKVSNIVDNLFGRDAEGYSSALTRLVSLAKNHAMMPTANDDAIISLISHFDVEWDDERISDADMCNMTRQVLRANNNDTLTIDFDDQLYFCVVFSAKLETFDFVLVDESQDTNPLRRILVQKMCHPTTRVIAVGDENQAIYGFTGASHDSMSLIQETFSAKPLPLSICYRCPSSVVRLAQTIVPHIQAQPNAPEGNVLHPPTFKRSDFLPTDLLICRNTAPLVQTAYKLLAARIPCKIMGREIGQGLTSLIKRLSRQRDTLETLATRLTEYRDTEVSKALAQKKETKAQNITDKVDSILALLDSMSPEDILRGIPGLIAIIESMFTDNGSVVTTLATVHKAKGMEAQRVFILDPSLMPSKWAKQAWQRQQERNLMYVAYTRALDTLVFVDSDKLTD